MRLCIVSTLCLIVAIFGSSYAADKLLQSSDMSYLGAFRMPSVSGFDYSTGTIGYNPSGNSLFIVGASSSPDYANRVAEISIPSSLVNSSDVSALPQAALLQPFADITEGSKNALGANGGTVGVTNGVKIGGLLVYGGSLYGSIYNYYEGATPAIRSHFKSSLNLVSTGDFSGLYKVGATPSPVPQAGLIAGYMAEIPASWQSALGGTVLSGKAGIPVINRTSYGPAAFAINPAQLTDTPNDANPATAAALVYYDNIANNGAHWTLGAWDYYSASNQYVSVGDNITGVAFPAGSKTVMFIGRHGSTNCYGPGTTIQAQVGNGYGTAAGTEANQCQGGSVDGPNDKCCYEHIDSIYNKGTHSYPYSAYVWAYNADDLASVKSGTKNPWEITPYAVWPITFPTTTYQGTVRDVAVSGAAYDASTQRLYVVQNGFEGNDRKPVIHVYQIAAGATPATTHSLGAFNGCGTFQ